MKIKDYQFLEKILDNIPTEQRCLQHRINTVMTKTVMAAPKNYENTRDIPKGLSVYLSVPSSLAGTARKVSLN